MRKMIVFVFSWGFLCQPCFAAGPALTWGDCLREAGKNNPDLVVAQEDVNQARASQAITASGLFPQISADASVSASRATASGKTTVGHEYAYGISGTQLIFDGLKASNNSKAAASNVVAAQESFRFSSADVRWKLRAAFVGLVKAQELVRVTGEIARSRVDAYKLIALRYEAGQEHKGALLNVRASMTQARFELKQAMRNLELSQRQLSKELGRREFLTIEAEDAFAVKEEIRQRPDFNKLAVAHPSVRQAIAKKNFAEFTLSGTRGGSYPKVLLQAGADKSGGEWPPEDKRLSAGVSVSVPIFEGGLRKAQISQAQAALRQATAQELSTEAETVFLLQQKWNAFQNAVDMVAVEQDMLAAAQERSLIAEAQYSTGLVTYDSWTIIEDNFIQAKKSLLDARANALLAEAEWVYAKGEVLEYAKE